MRIAWQQEAEQKFVGVLDDTHATIHQQPSKLFYLFYADSQNKIIIQRRRTVDHHSRPEYRYWK